MEKKLNHSEASKTQKISESGNRNLEICLPDGFEKCLIDFTVNVIKEKPVNIIQYAVQYFTEKLKEIEIDDSHDSGRVF